MKSGYLIGTLSNADVDHLTELAHFGGIRWDRIFGSDLFERFKPDPSVYERACDDLLKLPRTEVMLAAAHNYDLLAAQSVGLQTCFFPRRSEPEQPQAKYDVIGTDIGDVATKLGV